jgi:hypothetical protein
MTKFFENLKAETAPHKHIVSHKTLVDTFSLFVGIGVMSLAVAIVYPPAALITGFCIAMYYFTRHRWNKHLEEL